MSTAGWYTLSHTINPPDAMQAVALLRNPVPDVAGVARALNQRLDVIGSRWRFVPEPDTDSHTRVTPLALTYPSAEPWNQPVHGVSSLLDLLTEAGLTAAADPALLGSPAYKPGALTRGDFNRVPVSVVVDQPPPRRPAEALAGVRRPVVALLDTAVQTHPWLGPPDTDLTGDGYWVDARRMGWHPGTRLPENGPVTGLLARELGEQEGHGTFSAGLIRQVAPDARVLAVHVVDDTGRVYGDHVLNGIGWLQDSAGLVEGDVICVPVGFQPVLPTDVTYLEWLGEVLGELGERGVRVVAAAGNDGGDDRVYPAAFATADKRPREPLVSVGAANPNGRSHASYSNYGDWVTVWAVGTSVVSTFPAVNGAARAELAPGGDRESADPDDFTGGFARWSGTSFAAAIHAGRLAQKKLESLLA